jgi:hypothetical protein
MPRSKAPKVLKAEIIVLSHPNKPSPERMRRVVAVVAVGGQEREMTFLTNHLEWSPRSVAGLYRCRRPMEVFFKQIKQTLQSGDFLGHNAQRGALAGVDGAVGPRAVALLELLVEVVA